LKTEDQNPFSVLSALKFNEEQTESFNQDITDNNIATGIDYSLLTVRVWLEKKHRNGKPVSLITGFDVPFDLQKKLAKTIKTKLGVGGSVVNGDIIIQSQKRDDIINILKNEGIKNLKKAGG
jgi:translation initiation factor 1